MKIFIVGILFFSSGFYAASCCVGGGAKSFIQLRNFEKYQLGFSLFHKENYAKFNPYGDLKETKPNQTTTSSLGAGMRLRDDLDVNFLVPISRVESSTGLGDSMVGARYTLVDPLFLSDWYPKVNLSVQLKMPTGNQDGGNGNGLWEPGLSLIFEKDFNLVLLNFGTSYTYRSVKTGKEHFTGQNISVKEGDKFELSETVILPVTDTLSFALGSSQTWELASQINGEGVKDSHGRSIQGVISGTYYLSRIWKMTIGFDTTLPVEGWGTTLAATRTFTLTSTYSIY